MTQTLAGRLRQAAERYAFALVLAAGVGLRLAIVYVVFPGEGHHGDLFLHDRWLQVIADVGPGGFYERAGNALYPPVFSWVLWPLGVLARLLVDAGTPQTVATAEVVKLPAVLADGLIAILLYAAVTRWSGRGAGLLAAGLFLFIPVTWYESALWGQIDSVGTLFVLISLILLSEGWSEGATAAGVAAALVKPQFGIVLVVVAIVLVRRHLLLRGSGPVPSLSALPERIRASRAGRWLQEEQGLARLLTSALAAGFVGLVIVVPFDLPTRAPEGLAAVPLVGHVAGLLSVITEQLNKHRVLVANAFTPWALVGPRPLAETGLGMLTPDTLTVVDHLSAFRVGTILTTLAVLLGGTFAVLRDDRARPWAVVLILALALYLLPTRIHERYVYPAFVIAAPFAAVSRTWRAWYLVLGLATTVNLHAVLVDGGTAGLTSLPLGEVTKSEASIRLVAIVQGALGVVAVGLVLAGVGARRLRSGAASDPWHAPSSP